MLEKARGRLAAPGFATLTRGVMERARAEAPLIATLGAGLS